jgi:hypothetical protein
MPRVLATAAFAALLCVMAHPAAAQPEQSRTQGPNQLQQTVTVTVPEGATATIRMLNLSKGTRLAFVVQPQEPLAVLLLDEDNFKRFPHDATAIMTVRVSGSMSFAVQIPSDGNYYLALDNRERATPNKTQMQLRATLPAGAKRPQEPKPMLQQY